MDTAAWWDHFYKQCSSSREWYLEREHVIATVGAKLRGQAPGPLLHLGCGTSDLHTDLEALPAVRRVVNVDFSSVAVAEMTRRTGGDFREVDVRSMPCFEDACFAFGLDKGTLDCLLARGPPHVKLENAARMLREAWRIIRPGGMLLVLSASPPADRLPVFEACGCPWRVEHEALPWAPLEMLEPNTLTLYVAHRLPDERAPAAPDS